MDAITLIVFLSVVLGRFIIPLFILRYPLPATIAALVLDAADQTIFQLFTDSDLAGYQSYDKALDVYYLALAYISTMRNWTGVYAYRTGRFLWYYRLLGSTMFELIGWRPLLLIFPNTFEYFFIYIEAFRTRWRMHRLTRKHILVAAAFIWIVIKLPQEAWIHLFKLDVTDAFKEHILRTPLDAGWGEAFGNNLWIFPVLVAIAVGGAWLVRSISRGLPPTDWQTTFDANRNHDEFAHVQLRPLAERHWREGLIEKAVLVALMCIIFSQMLPNVDVGLLKMSAGVTFVVIANAAISHWLARRGTTWRSSATEFLALGVINLAAGLVYMWITPAGDDHISRFAVLFFTALLTLILTLYDRYRPVLEARHIAEARTAVSAAMNSPSMDVPPASGE